MKKEDNYGKENLKDVNADYYDEPVIANEMQKAVSFEIEHKAFVFYTIASCSVALNKKIRDRLTADEE